MNKFSWSVIIVTLFPWSASAAGTSTPGGRAYQFQREAREVLISHGWRISRDENGKLEATHPAGPLGAAGGGSSRIGLTPNAGPANAPFHAFGRLTLTFRADSLTRTNCSANSLLYFIWEGSRGKVKPTSFTDPETTKVIQDMITEAEDRLIKDHPEYSRKR